MDTIDIKSENKSTPNSLAVNGLVAKQTMIDYRASVSDVDDEQQKRQSFCQEMLTYLLDKNISKETIAGTIKTSIPTINRLLKNTTVNPNPRLFSRLLGYYFAVRYSIAKDQD